MTASEWLTMTVGDIAEVKGGKRLPTGYFVQAEPTPHPYIRVTDMRDGGIDDSDIKYVPTAAAPSIRAYRIRTHDIFISVAGTLGIVGRIPEWLDGANLTENADRITDIKCDVDYLAQYLRSAPIQNEIGSIRTVGAQPKLALGRIKTFKLLIPEDRAEQARVAQALGDADRLIDSLERLIGKKADIRYGMIQELLSNVPGDRVELSSVGGTVRGVSYAPEHLSPTPSDETIDLFRANNVQESRLLLSDLQYVHKSRVRADQYLRAGDVLICSSNGSKQLVGKAAVVPVLVDGSTFGAFMMVFRPDAGRAVPDYVALQFQTKAYRDWIELLLAGSSINNLRPADVGAFEIVLPARDEQERIADTVADFDAEIAGLANRLDSARAIKQGMVQELLTGRTRLLAEGVAA